MSDQHSLPPPIWVDTAPGFRAMLAHLRAEPALAVDTESNSLYVYHERVCLIQISVPGADYLVDSLLLYDLPGLGMLFGDPKVLKVLHGADYDLSVLHRDYSFTFRNLHDTMWASRILGWPAHGLAALLQEHFGVTLNKKFQRANWGLRPLPPQQLDYARLDTHYLLPLREIQVRELGARGRWPQARHRFGELASTRWEPKSFDADGFWRLPGLRELDDQGRGVLRELYLLRDQCARTGNRPPFRVLTNTAMLALSVERPSDIRGLHAVKGVSSGLVRRYGSELLEAINRGKARSLAWEERPRNNHHRQRVPSGHQSAATQARFEALRTWRNAKADALAVEPDIVLTNETLWEVALRNPVDHNDLTRDGLLAHWQADEFGNDLLAVIRDSTLD